MTSRQKLTDLAHWLGADAYYYVNVARFFQSIEEVESPQGAEVLKALDLIHLVIERTKYG